MRRLLKSRRKELIVIIHLRLDDKIMLSFKATKVDITKSDVIGIIISRKTDLSYCCSVFYHRKAYGSAAHFCGIPTAPFIIRNKPYFNIIIY